MEIKKLFTTIIDLNSHVERDIKKASEYYHKGTNFWKAVSYIKHRKNRRKYNIEIYPECELGKIIIPHSVGIVIGRTAKIGDNVTIMPNVVIGAKYSPKEKNPEGRRHAIIGDNCILGTGCKIIGKIKIGKNCTIGANAVVSKDVPDNSLVINVNQIINRLENTDGK